MTIPLKRSLVDIALEQIRQRIDAGHWPLGQRLPPEPELAELLGMSRNTVREAVRVLTFSGVLEVRQGDGTYVRACADPLETMLVLARSAVQHSLEARGMIEIEAARLAAVRRDDSDLSALREHLDASRQRYGSADLQDYIEHDVRFTNGWSMPPTIRCSANSTAISRRSSGPRWNAPWPTHKGPSPASSCTSNCSTP